MENGRISSIAMDDESFVVIFVGIRTRGLRIHTTPPPPPPPKPHTRTYQVRIIHSPAMAFVLLVIPQGVRKMQLQQVRLAIKGKVLAILLFVRGGGGGERGREGGRQEVTGGYFFEKTRKPVTRHVPRRPRRRPRGRRAA